MAGISSKAAGVLENKKRYNGIELNNDFDINTYEAFYRNLDVQIGKWWQIDPEIEDQENLSPYTSMANDPVLKSDPLGNVPEEGDEDPPTKKGTASAGVVIATTIVEGGTLGGAVVAGSAVAPVALVIYHPEVLLSGGASAAQMDFNVERQIRQYANAPATATSVAPPVKTLPGYWDKMKMAQGAAKNNTPKASGLPKSPKGKGSVPPNQRDPKRKWTKKERGEMLDKQDGTCADCGQSKSVDEVHAHHKKRHADGGATDDKNGAAVCPDCHKEIHQK